MIDRKKLKEEYKRMINDKGVFVVRNTVNNKVFLGSSLNLKNKFERIKLMLNTGNHYNSEFQNDWKKYGEDSFVYEVLETLKIHNEENYNYSSDLEILEILWIDKFQPFNEKCYNKKEKIRMV